MVALALALALALELALALALNTKTEEELRYQLPPVLLSLQREGGIRPRQHLQRNFTIGSIGLIVYLHVIPVGLAYNSLCI